MNKIRIELSGDWVRILIDGKVVVEITLGEWSHAIANPGKYIKKV